MVSLTELLVERYVLGHTSGSRHWQKKRAAFGPRAAKATAEEAKPGTPTAEAPPAAPAGEPAVQGAAPAEAAAAEATKAEPAEAAAPEASKEEARTGGNGSVDFTEEQDQQLLGLKGAGQSWKYIAMTLDKSVGEIKHRYHQIKPKDETANAKEKAAIDKAAKAAEAKAKGLAAKAVKEEAKKAKSEQEVPQAHAADTQAHAQGGVAQGWIPGAYPNQYVLEEDEYFSYSDLQLIARLVQKEQEQLWLRVASRFYDHTERRIHPDDIRDKVQGRFSQDI